MGGKGPAWLNPVQNFKFRHKPPTNSGLIKDKTIQSQQTSERHTATLLAARREIRWIFGVFGVHGRTIVNGAAKKTSDVVEGRSQRSRTTRSLAGELWKR